MLVTCFSITNCLKEHNWLYRTGNSLGIGSFGQVFSVEHKLDGSKYAVKKLKQTTEDNAEVKVKEAERMCHLLHRNVCRYYNAWQESGFVHIRMELCDKDLAAWIKRRNSLLFKNHETSEPYDKVLQDSWVLADSDWSRQHAGGRTSSQQTWFKGIKARGTNEFLKGVLKGVQYLHECRHLAHQDLHMKNVLLKFDAHQNAVTAKICDFGLASTKTGNSNSAAVDDNFCKDLESVGKILVRMYYPLSGDEVCPAALLSKLQNSSENHKKELNPGFLQKWPDQASWIRRLLSLEEKKPSAAMMLDEGMRSESESFPSEKYRKGREDRALRD